MNPIVYRASVADAIDLAPRLRSADVEELRAGSGLSPLSALTKGVQTSTVCYAAADSDGVFALFGAADQGEGRAAIWLLASDRLFEHKRFIVREAPKWVVRFHQRWPTLFNFVDTLNEKHVRFLKHLGCGFGELPANERFQLFYHV
jgi:hypothetical protein